MHQPTRAMHYSCRLVMKMLTVCSLSFRSSLSHLLLQTDVLQCGLYLKCQIHRGCDRMKLMLPCFRPFIRSSLCGAWLLLRCKPYSLRQNVDIAPSSLPLREISNVAAMKSVIKWPSCISTRLGHVSEFACKAIYPLTRGLKTSFYQHHSWRKDV